MKTRSSELTRFALVLGLAAWSAGPPAVAQDAPVLGIALNPGVEISVTGEVGATYVIESKNGVEGDFWLTRGWIELSTPTAMWMDPVPTDSPRRVYRAVKVTKPVVQTIPNMVWIPPGTFTMGSPEGERGRFDWEGPQTRVTLTKGFWLGKYEVTQGEYVALMGNSPSFFTEYGTDLPVESVHWYDATNYCAKLTERERAAGRIATNSVYRLPTEAEWEFACRAGTSTQFSYGDDLGCTELTKYAWYWDNSYTTTWPSGSCYSEEGRCYTTHPVGRKLPNPWGLYDLHGNVWEWCQNWWLNSLAGGIAVDPQGPVRGYNRVIRGGGWYDWYFWESDARGCRSADRFNYYDSESFIGFRVLFAPGQP